MVLREQILSMNPASLLFAAVFLIFIHLATINPTEIELFGNDVDSIRIVDPETQLSERKLLQVSIIPNVDTQFENEERVSLLDFLPQNTVVWFQDHDWCKERLSDCEEDLDLFLQREANSEKDKTRLPAGRDNNDDRLIKKNVTADDFISVKEFEEKILDRHFVEFSYQPSSIGHHYEIELIRNSNPHSTGSLIF